ncbi:unnamed protein product [Leptidea sinapis]|uniref:Uncharacterized protein n=1 Tax=Leptidea sinapis TaxID=189913 RepID=A0A5E4Q2Z4_9NEOP|nr:unnamed protein product [Leptidea sinapis]
MEIGNPPEPNIDAVSANTVENIGVDFAPSIVTPGHKVTVETQTNINHRTVAVQTVTQIPRSSVIRRWTDTVTTPVLIPNRCEKCITREEMVELIRDGINSTFEAIFKELNDEIKADLNKSIASELKKQIKSLLVDM